MTRVITTSLASKQKDINLAKIISEEHSFKYIKREDLSIDSFFEKYKCSNFFMVKNNQLILINQKKEELFFHPGTSSIRTKSLEKNNNDLLIETLGISPKDSVLDCTGGLLSDSIVISYFLREGKLTTLEKSKELFIISKYGLEYYSGGSEKLKESFKRINLINIDYNLFFKNLEENDIGTKYDSIYFDPMFEVPVLESSGIYKIREYSCYDVLTKDIIEKAMKFAKKRVVVKIRNNNYSFIKNTKPDQILGGSGSKIRYALFEK